MWSSDSRVDAILSRFPGPVTLYPSRTKWLLILLGCGLFAAIGYWMISDGDRRGWFVLIFFGAGSIAAAMMLLPGAGALTLDRDGFRAATLFRGSLSRWQDVTGFESASVPPANQKLVVYDDINVTGRKLAKFNVALVGPRCLRRMGSRPTTSLGS